jgi:hypothetical protein
VTVADAAAVNAAIRAGNAVRVRDLLRGATDKERGAVLKALKPFLQQLVAAWPLLAPHQPEVIAAHLLSALSEGLVPGRSAASTAARAVARLRGTFGLIGHVALVVVLGDPSAPQTILEIAWVNSALSVSFVDEEGRTHTEYLFRKMENGKLFMHDAATWTYPEGAQRMSQASHIETAQFRPDGYASRTIDDSSAGQIEKTEYTDVPVENNWEPMPEFGHWESVARYNRDAPPNPDQPRL